MQEERRKHPRYQIHQLIELSFGKEIYIGAHSIDISEGGLYCQVSKPMEPYSRVFLMIGIPQKEAELQITCEGMVLRTEAKEDKHFVAIEFTSMGNAYKKQLKEYLSQE